MQQYVSNYEIVRAIPPRDYNFIGNSVGNKRVLPHIFEDPIRARTVLDIGFGVGDLGTILKSDPAIKHWEIDGIDGFQDACCNAPLFQRRIYRNVWHGLAQELPQAMLNSYDVICLFDVIEHLDIDNATRLLGASGVRTARVGCAGSEGRRRALPSGGLKVRHPSQLTHESLAA
jgi:2-polyprenyl-3-methyl-5-hydroxy-6-metoxy-1,4-benzoquinol methylase